MYTQFNGPDTLALFLSLDWQLAFDDLWKTPEVWEYRQFPTQVKVPFLKRSRKPEFTYVGNDPTPPPHLFVIPRSLNMHFYNVSVHV